MDWKLADAKNKFSEVVKRALTEGPQRVTRRDDAVVILSEADYERLAGQRAGFREYLMSGPTLVDVDLERDRSAMREVGDL